MIINATNLQAASKGFRALYREEMAKASSVHQTLAMVIESSSPEENYAFLKALPRMREWLGDRVVHGLEAAGFTIRKKDWEATIAVDRDEILFDKLNLVRPRIQELARAAQAHYMDLLVDLLAEGFAKECYDGQYFFDEDHPVGGASVSNKGAAPLSGDAYEAAYAAMQAVKDDAGKPLGVRPTHLVVPPQLRGMAKRILEADLLEGETNVNKGSADLLVLPELAGHPKKWFLLDLSRPLKPFILQVVKQPEFVALDRPDDEGVFRRREFLYGVDCIDNAGYGLWQLAWGSTGEGSGP